MALSTGLTLAALALWIAASSAQPLPAEAPTTAQDPQSALRNEVSDLRSRMNGLSQLGILRDAVRMGEEAFSLAEAGLGSDDIDTLGVANDLANVYVQLGRYADAERLRVQALQGVERRLGNDHPDTLVARMNLASLYHVQGRYAEAEPLYRAVLDAQLPTVSRDRPDAIVTMINLAELYQRQGFLDRAEPLLRQALELGDRLLGRDDPIVRATVTSLAHLSRTQGRYADAARHYERALEPNPTTLRLMNHPDNLAASAGLAAVYALRGQDARAESLYEWVVDAAEMTMGRLHPATIGYAAELARLRLRRSGRSSAALVPARLAASGLRARRSASPSDSFGAAQGNRETDRPSSDFYLLANAGWAARSMTGAELAPLRDEAFLALQDGMAGRTSRAVVRMAVRRLAEGSSATVGALTREREALEDEWANNNQSYGEAAAIPGLESRALRERLEADRGRIENRMGAIDDQLRRDFPQYFALTRAEAVPLREAQALLQPDEAILLAVPTEFGTHIVALSNDSALWARSSWTEERVEAAVDRLHTDIRRTLRSRGEVYTFDRGTAHALYGELVRPAARILRGKRHVFVAAAGALSTLPFGILVTQPPRGEDSDSAALRETDWFADAHALVQIPSVQSLAFLRRFAGVGRSRGEGTAFIGMGNPRLEGPSDYVAGRAGCGRGSDQPTGGASAIATREPSDSGAMIADAGAIRRLCPLPGTAQELEGIRLALGAPPSALLVGDQFTEPRIRQADLSQARIIVFATHAIVAGALSAPTEPGLILTPPPTAREGDDGYLAASEVTTLHLDADWVILSACDTAAGDGSSGAEGLSGLARAFFYAGARNLLASHWPVCRF